MEASVVGGSAVLEEKSLVVGAWLDMFDTKTRKWYPARIAVEEESRVWVQFHGWGDRHNQWIEKVSGWRNKARVPERAAVVCCLLFCGVFAWSLMCVFCGVFCFALLCWPKKNKLDLMSVTTGDLSGLKFIGSGDGMG